MCVYGVRVRIQICPCVRACVYACVHVEYVTMAVTIWGDSGTFIRSSNFLLLTQLLRNHNNGNNRNTEDVFSAQSCSDYFMSLNTVDANNPSKRGGLFGASFYKNVQVEGTQPVDSSIKSRAQEPDSRALPAPRETQYVSAYGSVDSQSI